MLREDSAVTGGVDFGPRIDGVEPVSDKRREVRGVGVRVTEEQLLGWNGA